MPLPCRHPAVTRSRLRRSVGLLTVLLALACCTRDQPPQQRLRTVVRVLDPDVILARRDPRLVRGSHVFLAHEARPALTSAMSFVPALSCDDAPESARSCSAAIPKHMPLAQQAILQHWVDPSPKHAEDATAATSPAAAASPRAGALGRSQLLTPGALVPVGPLSNVEAFLLRAYPAPPLPERSLETGPLVVPAGALLRLSIGIEEAAWWMDSAPVQFRVVVEEAGGTSQDLFRRVLDPARRPQDRRWFDSDVDLSDLAGRTVRLRFVTEPAQSSDTRPSLPLWGDPRVLAPHGGNGHPSVVLVSLDTLRAKSMSTYGHHLDTSPFLTALAAQGALFASAFTTYSNTLPSHMSMLTGLYPATHAVLEPSNVLGSAHVTLAELLRHAGFTTGAFTEDALLDSRRGFRRGFSTYYENTGTEHGAGDAQGTFGRALEWAGRNADAPFFLFIHTYQVHFPYEPPQAYQQLFTADDGAQLSAAQRAYEQEIRYLDDVLQRLVEGLRKVVPENDLILVITADHGEEFFEHGAPLHNQLYEEVMHIPLLVVWAGRVPAGLRISPPVSLVDVAPTILDLLGVPIPEAMEGQSLAPLLTGETTVLAREAVFGEYPQSTFALERHFVAHNGDAKCILGASGHDDYCFDLRKDPGETSRRTSDETAAFSRLHALGDSYRLRALAHSPSRPPRAPDVAKTGPKQASPPASTAGEAPPANEMPEPADAIERKLRALGYVE